MTRRYKSDLLHIGVDRPHNGRSVLLLVKDLDVRILTLDGELIRQLTIDPKRNLLGPFIRSVPRPGVSRGASVWGTTIGETG